MERHLKTATLNDPVIIVIISFAAGTLCACSGAQITQGTDKRSRMQPTKLCDLLKNLQFYRGKIVAVRGIYWYGLRQTCPEPFVTSGHTWPSALNLADSDFMAKYGDPVPFETDRESWDRLDELTIREGKAGRREEIWVTIVGKLQTPEAYTRRDGQVVGGYGHLGVFPAELVVERVSEIAIKSNPSYDYREILRGPMQH
jgi:hypothetical protein